MNEISVTPAEGTLPAQNAEGNMVNSGQVTSEPAPKSSMLLAILGGLAASVVAAVLWALITYATGYQIGFMALGVGIAVGFAVNLCGSGTTTPFGVIGAVLALFGCLLGNLLTAVIAISQVEDVSMILVVLGLATSPGIIVEIFTETFSPIDILFYVLAIWEGFKFSIRG